MARFGFTTSGSYTSQSRNAADDKLLNMYNETNEAPNGKSPMSLYQRPGLSLFCQLTFETPEPIRTRVSQPSVPALITFNGRTFALAGNQFYEILGMFSTVVRGNVAYDGSVGSLAAGPNQILVASGGLMYVLTLDTNVFTTVDEATYIQPINQVAYSDGFFIATTDSKGEFQVSSPDDATTWSLLDESIVSVFPDE